MGCPGGKWASHNVFRNKRNQNGRRICKKVYLTLLLWKSCATFFYCLGTNMARLIAEVQSKNRYAVVLNFWDGGKTLIKFLSVSRKQIVATGDSQGRIKIWRLSDDLINQSAREEEFLAAIASDAQTEWRSVIDRLFPFREHQLGVWRRVAATKLALDGWRLTFIPLCSWGWVDLLDLRLIQVSSPLRSFVCQMNNSLEVTGLRQTGPWVYS